MHIFVAKYEMKQTFYCTVNVISKHRIKQLLMIAFHSVKVFVSNNVKKLNKTIIEEISHFHCKLNYREQTWLLSLIMLIVMTDLSMTFFQAY